MKRCFKCGDEKPIADFYRHPRMSDGHLNKCKDCTKRDAAEHRENNLEKVREYDRKRGQLPHRKQGVKKRAARYLEQKKEWFSRYKENNPQKHKAHGIVQRAIRSGKLKVQPCERCGDGIGVQAHHEDYSKPLDVMWLCPRHHGERHREINEERRRSAA